MNFEKTISQRGYRLSGARKQILGILSEVDQPLSPAGLFEKLQEKGSGTSLVTVYRNLDFLADLGLVEKIFTEKG